MTLFSTATYALSQCLWQIFSVVKGRAHKMWGQLGGQISFLAPERYGLVDWSMYVSLLFYILGFYPNLFVGFYLFESLLTCLLGMFFPVVCYSLYFVGFFGEILTPVIFYSFGGIIVDSLEAKEIVSRWVCLTFLLKLDWLYNLIIIFKRISVVSTTCSIWLTTDHFHLLNQSNYSGLPY